MRQFLINPLFNRPQGRGEPGLAFGEQLAHARAVSIGRMLALTKTSPGL